MKTTVKTKNSCKRWIESDDRMMFEMRERGVDFETIGETLGRSAKSIQQRANKLKREDRVPSIKERVRVVASVTQHPSSPPPVPVRPEDASRIKALEDKLADTELKLKMAMYILKEKGFEL